MEWTVHIPAGFRLEGTHTFSSERGATNFADYWQDMESAGREKPVAYPLITAHRKAA